MLLIRRFNSSIGRITRIGNGYKTGDSLTMQGWIKHIRRLKNNIFLDINDGSANTNIQVVVPKNAQTQKLSVNSVVNAKGLIQVAPSGHFELHADNICLISEGNLNNGYPFSPKQAHAPEYVREHLHLRSRFSKFAAQMRIRHQAQKAVHDFMDKHDFVHVNTPILTTNDCEGAGELFRVQPNSDVLLKQMARASVPLEQCFFDNKVFLTVSGQMHLEAMSYGLGNTYTLGPAFRAENSKSSLHLAEFFMLEAELVHMEQLDELATFIENMLKTITNRLLSKSYEDIVFCQRKTSVCTAAANMNMPWLDIAWKTITYDEAMAIITANKSILTTAVSPDEGFSKEQELFLVAHCGSPVFVVDWPAKQKPFYMKSSRSEPDKVYALDLLMPFVGELCGGSLRECDAQRLSTHPGLPKELTWYVELRKYGGLSTGGFGMGFERYLQLLTGVKNIRDVIPFPRYPHSCRM